MTVNLLPVLGQTLLHGFRIAMVIQYMNCTNWMNGKGYCMKIGISGTGVHLEGDWSLAGVTQSAIDSLAVALQQLEAVGASRLDVDCRQVNAIDTNGQQILYVWLQCLRFRGVEPEVINFPDNLQNISKSLQPSSSDTAGPSTPTHGKAVRTTWPSTAITASPMRSVVNS